MTGPDCFSRKGTISYWGETSPEIYYRAKQPLGSSADLIHWKGAATGTTRCIWRSDSLRSSHYGAVDSRSLARQRFLTLLFGIFAGLALLLACTRVYGVLAYLTGQRTSEIGVQIAMGANMRDVIQLVLWQSLKMTLAGIGIGIIVALAAGRVLSISFRECRPSMERVLRL